MKKLYALMGKSASGKDTILKRLEEAGAKRIVTHTTRPMRPHEQNGREYFFHSNDEHESRKYAGLILEEREYPVAGGPWYYWTENFHLTDDKNVIVTTPEGFPTLDAYMMGQEDAVIIPVLIEVKDEIRIQRLIERESESGGGFPAAKQISEITRRFHTDNLDFEEKNIPKNAIRVRNEDADSVNRIVEMLM